MSTQYETGHARNLAAFETMISFCTSYGADYQPTQDNLKISAMQTQLAGGCLKTGVGLFAITSICHFGRSEKSLIRLIFDASTSSA